jgi:hypothetical protein
MHRAPTVKPIAGLIALALCLAACDGVRKAPGAPPNIVGAWVVKIPDAPFPMHMFVFHSDGTVQQSNPDAGDSKTSDSNLMGAWRAGGDHYTGKLVEVTADRATHEFATRGEISFALKVNGNTFEGTASATFYDAAGHQIRGPIQVRMEGDRVLP